MKFAGLQRLDVFSDVREDIDQGDVHPKIPFSLNIKVCLVTTAQQCAAYTELANQ